MVARPTQPPQSSLVGKYTATWLRPDGCSVIPFAAMALAMIALTSHEPGSWICCQSRTVGAMVIRPAD